MDKYRVLIHTSNCKSVSSPYSYRAQTLVCNCSKFCCTLLYVHSSFAITLMVKRELVALLFVFLVSRDGYVALLRGAMGLSAVCDCGIS